MLFLGELICLIMIFQVLLENCFFRSFSCEFKIAISTWTLRELYKQIDVNSVKMLLEMLKKKIVIIKYSDEDLTQQSKDFSDTMNIYPEEYKIEMPKVLDWFDDRAVIRKGSWLGTEFPFKKGWIIEPISDSTLYPAYYIISKYVNEKKITVKDLTEEFFDYIFLGKGKTKNDVWNDIKSEFDY